MYKLLYVCVCEALMSSHHISSYFTNGTVSIVWYHDWFTSSDLNDHGELSFPKPCGHTEGVLTVSDRARCSIEVVGLVCGIFPVNGQSLIMSHNPNWHSLRTFSKAVHISANLPAIQDMYERKIVSNLKARHKFTRKGSEMKVHFLHTSEGEVAISWVLSCDLTGSNGPIRFS